MNTFYDAVRTFFPDHTEDEVSELANVAYEAVWEAELEMNHEKRKKAKEEKKGQA